MSPDFIGQYPGAVPAVACERLIQMFEDSSEFHVRGEVSGGFIRPNVKDDTEIKITSDFLEAHPQWTEAINPVFRGLETGLAAYKLQYPGTDCVAKWALEDAINFQRFSPGTGFTQIHCETGSRRSAKRVLVWMLYLNTLTDKGGTEFPAYEFTCRAEAGKIVIWPPYWTHIHRSEVSPSQTKYIFTGWMEFK